MACGPVSAPLRSLDTSISAPLTSVTVMVIWPGTMGDACVMKNALAVRHVPFCVQRLCSVKSVGAPLTT